MTYVEDPGLNSLDPEDDQVLPIFNRLPASFGTDSYVLQNVDGNTARDHGLDLVLERVFDGRWGMLIGATAHKSNGSGGNRGFRPDENDQGELGEAFSDPNARVRARTAVLRTRIRDQVVGDVPAALPAPWRDGGPLPGRPALLTSRDCSPIRAGRGTVPALPRGLTRFTYMFTLDSRLERQLRIGGRDTSLIFEVFNMLNTNNEVEENEVSGPAFRAPTAVQPPRSLRLGFRFTF